MKVLVIGQLPIEVGGTYTTGICNVVYELSKCHNPDIDLFVYATNITDKKAKSIKSKTRYFGTKKNISTFLRSLFILPIKTIQQWIEYYQMYHMLPFRFEFYKENIERVIEIVDPDIIHCMNNLQTAPSYYALKDKKRPIIVTLHGVFDVQKKDEGFIKGLSKWADFYTGLTPVTMSDILDMGLDPRKAYVVPNGVDTQKMYFDSVSRKILRNELGVDENTTIMMTVGSLQQRKGQLDFCRLLTKLPIEFNFKYLLIGSGPDLEQIEKFVNENSLQNKVSIIGYVQNNELFKYHSAADIYIHCSYQEGQALSEIEAYATDSKIAVNKDIIGTIVTDTKIETDYYIFDFDNFDTSKFVEWAAIHKLNRKTRKQYDWHFIFNEYLRVYNQILESNE